MGATKYYAIEARFFCSGKRKNTRVLIPRNSVLQYKFKYSDLSAKYRQQNQDLPQETFNLVEKKGPHKK